MITYRLPPTAGTTYIGGIFEENRDNGFVTDWTKYYTALGRTIAFRKIQFGDQLGTLYYPLHDHLGTTVGITNNLGTLVSSQKYWPYGGLRSGSITETDKLYTGQQIESGDSALGLYNYKARFYSTTLGRFATADSWTDDGLNRYAYVRNNPMTHDDPTGHKTDVQLDLEAAQRSSAPPCDDYCRCVANPVACQALADARPAERPCVLCIPVPVLPQDKQEVINEDIRRVVEGFKLLAQDLLGTLASDGGDDAGIGPDGQAAEPVPDDPAIDAVAKRIANGHAGQKHADDFPGLTPEELAKTVGAIIRSPTATKTGANGRVAYWDESSGTIVIVNPGDSDGGTVFKPAGGRSYFDNDFD